jgi:hypothetical protein
MIALWDPKYNSGSQKVSIGKGKWTLKRQQKPPITLAGGQFIFEAIIDE